MTEIITCFGDHKEIMGWLADLRCHPEISYDVLRKRLKRSGPLSIPEMAITTPVIKGAQRGDTAARTRDRKLKIKERYKGFVLAKKVREKYDAGVDRADIKQRFDITEGFLQKIISKQYYWNIHWEMCRPGECPEHFKEVKYELEYVPGAKDGLEKYNDQN